MITTRQAAKKLGIGAKTLSNYIAVKKVPAPEVIKFGKFVVHSWTEEEIEHVRKLLPKVANGRKTRYSKLRENEKAQAKSPVPNKPPKPKKKKSP
jgi:predicted DNA-binding transcriptional regulator AlpA